GEPAPLGGVDPQEGAPDARVLMDATGGVCPPAVAERDPPALEVPEEFFPFGIGRGAVFFAGPELTAAGDERSVAADRLFGIDRFISHCRVYVAVPEYQLGDMRRHPVHDGLGGKDPPEIVGAEIHRLPVAAGDAG